MSETTLIVGDSGQDGRLLRERLEAIGHCVIGISRDGVRAPLEVKKCLTSEFSILNYKNVEELLETIKPSAVFYFAAHHFSSEAKEQNVCTVEYEDYNNINVLGLLNFLSAIKATRLETKIFYACSSLVYDPTASGRVDEQTGFSPIGFYALTKAQGAYLCRDFRNRLGVFATVGILFNHESALRTEKFFSKKVISGAHRIACGVQNDLELGSLESGADWGYAPDFVDAFQRIISLNCPSDYVVATGEFHTARDFVDLVFKEFGLNYINHVRLMESRIHRAPRRLIGDFAKLRADTGWAPTYDFRSMVKTLVKDYVNAHKLTLEDISLTRM